MGATILALDPGVTTGWAELRNGKICTGQIEEDHDHFYKWLDKMDPSVVVYESFVYQRRNKVELYPVEVIGVIRLWAQFIDVPVFVQSPSQAKGFMPDPKLKKMGLWVKGQKHGMDALRHLMYHLVVTRGEQSWLSPLNPDL